MTQVLLATLLLALGVSSPLALRWSFDDTRVSQLARDNGIDHRAEPTEAERLAAEAQACETVTSSPPLRFALQAVRSAAVFGLGDRVDGLAELQQARSEFADHDAGPSSTPGLLDGMHDHGQDWTDS